MDALTQLGSALRDRYQIDREIGRGGMATVYLAQDLKHNRNVALKVLNPELGAVLGVERFLAEIQVTANLQHPNLLPLFDSGEADGLLFYVMPYVEGESLRARLDREKQLPVDETIRIGVAVAGALDYAHRHNVIHRDLKPENILLHEGQPLVADFGIALAVSNAGGNRITQTGLSLGTPQYMSPEQATGDRVIDGRTDIYSLAAVLYEMLAGEPPHTGGTAQAIIARVLTDRPRPLRSSRSTVPPHVEQAIELGLEKLSADRWPTAHDFAAALEGRTVAGTLQQSPKEVRERQRTIGSRLRDPLFIAASVVAIAGITLAVRGALRATTPVDSVVQFEIAMPPNVALAPFLGRELAFSPDGEAVLFVGFDRGADRQLYLRRLDEHTVRLLPGTGGAQNPVFSPDGRWIAFSAGRSLRKVSVLGGAAVQLAEVNPIYGQTWSPSGNLVFSLNGTLAVVPASGGAVRILTRLDTASGEFDQRWPIALPDGRTVLYASFAVGSGGDQTNSRIAIASIVDGKTDILDLPGTAPIGIIDGLLVYATVNNAIMAAPIDLGKRRVTGAPFPVVTNVSTRPSGAVKAALSGTGSLAFEGGSPHSQVALVDDHGASRPLVEQLAGYNHPRLSPDGRRLALTITGEGRSDIWLYDIGIKTMTRLTTEGTANERPEWSPDGKRVMFLSRRQTAALYWQPADLSRSAEPLLESKTRNYYEGVISADGKWLAYQFDSLGTGSADVFVKSLAGDTTPHAISATRFGESHPRISPDGRWIAYVSDESGKRQVVVQPFPAGGGRVQVSPGGGDEPVWSRDGKRLFYRNADAMVAAEYTAAPFFAITSRKTLFTGNYAYAPQPHANYDVTPDGHSFVMVKQVEEQQFIVIHNWRAQLHDAMLGRTTR